MSKSPNKTVVIDAIIAKLESDLEVLVAAAKASHEAATHEDNAPENKYDTLALETSYIAQGQANRAAEIKVTLDHFNQLKNKPLNNKVIQQGSLVELIKDDATKMWVFIANDGGGLKVKCDQTNILVVSSKSPLGQELLNLTTGDVTEVEAGGSIKTYEILTIL